MNKKRLYAILFAAILLLVIICIVGICHSGICRFFSDTDRLTASIVQCKGTRWGYGLKNSLDGDANDDYTSFRRSKHPTVFELELSHPVTNLQLNVIFESVKNYAEDWQVEALDDKNQLVAVSRVAGKAQDQQTCIYAARPFRYLRFTFRKFAGQQRLLLRQISFTELGKKWFYPDAKSDLSVRYLYSDPCYDNFGLENSLDGKRANDYTAFMELKTPTRFDLELSKPLDRMKMEIVFESAANYATEWQLELLDEQEKVICTIPVKGSGQYYTTFLTAKNKFKYLRFTFRKFAGQQRLLLRRISFTELEKNARFYPTAKADLLVRCLYSDPCYDKCGLENSLDGKPDNNYTAFEESTAPTRFGLELSKPQSRLNMEIIFESAENYATEWQLELLDEQGKVVRTIQVQNSRSNNTTLLAANKKFKFLRLSFSKFAGQKRLLMRLLTFRPDILSDSYFSLDISGEKRMLIPGLAKHFITPVSIAKLGNDYLIVDYKHCWLFDSSKQELINLRVDFSRFGPAGKDFCCQPTGCAIDADGKIYIANYGGNNVLQGRLDLAEKKIIIEREYRSKNTISPENLVIDTKRKMLFSANYDGGTVTAFDLVSGKELWVASVPQAHGVTTDGEFVYATGLVDRNIVRIDLQTGSILQKTGSLGWDPERRQFLWPTSLEMLDDNTLIVTDAHTGFISLVDKKTLQTRSFFGGNGLGRRFFNYPYAAKVFDDEVWVLNTFRLEIVVLDRKTFKSLRRYNLNHTIDRGEYQYPFGLGWEGYINWQDSGKVPFAGKEYHTGFAKIHQPRNILELPLPATLFCPNSRYVYLLQNHVEGEVTFLWSSSSHHLFILVNDPTGGVTFFVDDITVDSWKDGDSISTKKNRIPFRELAASARKKHQRLLYLRMLYGIPQRHIMKEFFHAGMKQAEYEKLFDKVFSSYAGARFKKVYDRYCAGNGTPDEVKEAARIYYGRTAEGNIHKQLDEIVLVSMLTGVSPQDMRPHEHPKVIDPNAVDLMYIRQCIKVSDLKPYGDAKGYQGYKKYKNRSLLHQTLESLKSWQSEAFALRFCMELPPEAQAVCYELFQPAGNIIHTVVEVKEPSGVVTYDPTLGCAYRASVRQMLEGKMDIEKITLPGKTAIPISVRNFRGEILFFGARIKDQIKFSDIKDK